MRKNKLPFLLIILGVIAAVSHLQWLNPGSTLTHADWGFWPTAAIKDLWFTWGTWAGYYNLGSSNVQIPFLLFNSLWSLFANIGLTYDHAVKLTFFIPIMVLGFLSPFLLGRRLFKDDIIAFTLALFYAATPYFLIRQIAHLPIAFVYALTPLVLFLFDRALERNKIKDWLYFTGCYWIISCYEIRITYIVTFILIGYLLALHAKEILRYTRGLLVSAAFFIGLSLFWVLPTVLGGLTSDVIKTADVGLFGSPLFDIQHALTIMDSSWTGEAPNEQFIMQPVLWYLWLLPVFALLGLFVARPKTLQDRKRLIFFGILAVIGIFLTKQASAPFYSAYSTLYEHLPGFNLYREASKFYLVTAMGYFGLFGFLLVSLKERPNTKFLKRPLFYGLVVTGLLFISLSNLKPLLLQKYGTLFTSKTIPTDFIKLNKYIIEDSAFYRTAWLPTASRWATFTVQHPRLNITDLAAGFWRATKNVEELSRPIYKYSSELLSKNYASTLISAAGIRYIAVPSTDIENNNNVFQFYGNDRQFYLDTLGRVPWLKKLDLNTKELIVYENKNPKPYFSPATNITNLASSGGLDEKYKFITETLKTEFTFTTGDKIPGTKLSDLFEDIKTENINDGKLVISPKNLIESSRIYANVNKPHLTYRTANNTLTFTQRTRTALMADENSIGPQKDETKILSQVVLRPNSEYALGIKDQLLTLSGNSSHDLGTPAEAPIVYGIDALNRITNPSLFEGLWRKKVEDCNPYDSNPFMSMSLADDEYKVEKVLELTADHHTACTGPAAVSVRPGERLMVQFDYRVEQGKEAGYELEYNDPSQTINRFQFSVTDGDWRTLRQATTVPAGATTVRLRLKAFPNEQKPLKGIVHYTNARLSTLTIVSRVQISSTPQYTQITLPAYTRQLSYAEPELDGRNLIPNSSLELGLWQEKVGDCNAHDNRPALGMRLNTQDKSNGAQSLQLEAKRHIACTGPSKVGVKEGHTYLLSFDYQSPNAKSGGYSVSFNDPDRSWVNNGGLQIADRKWHTLNRTFTVPYGATEASVSVYAYSEEEPSTKTVINRYDNFRLVEIPDVQNQYYLVNDPGQKLVAPRETGFTLSSPTKKLVHIKGATTPFYLAMSEAYHPSWQLELNDERVQGANSWAPWAQPHTVAAGNHFKLDDFLNGWYVDPAALCQAGAGCTQQADGSYDLELVAEFAPQRWFYVGCIISGVTLAGCLGYLAWSWRRQRRSRLPRRGPDSKVITRR